MRKLFDDAKIFDVTLGVPVSLSPAYTLYIEYWVNGITSLLKKVSQSTLLRDIHKSHPDSDRDYEIKDQNVCIAKMASLKLSEKYMSVPTFPQGKST